MSKKNKYKGLGLLITLFSCFIANLLADEFLTLPPIVLSSILVILTISGSVTLTLILILPLMKLKGPLFGKIVSWIFLLPIAMALSGVSIKTSAEAIEEIWLYKIGLLTTAMVVDCQRSTPELGRYRITYQWSLSPENSEGNLYAGQADIYQDWLNCPSPGEVIPIRYLPNKPTSFRLELELGPESNPIFFPLFINLCLFLIGIIYIRQNGLP